MTEQTILGERLSEEIVTNMSVIAQLDSTRFSEDFTRSVEPLQDTQDSIISSIETALNDIPTSDLTNDRLDLLSAVAVGELGTTSAELIVKEALKARIIERRDQYIKRQHQLGKLMRGKGQYFAVTPLVNDIVVRSGTWTTSPKPEQIYKDYTLYMRTFRNRSIAVFTTYPSDIRTRESYNSGRNYNGYSMFGVAQRSIGERMCDVSLVDLAGNPIVSIVPLNGKPSQISPPTPRYI